MAGCLSNSNGPHAFTEHRQLGLIFCTNCGEFRGATQEVGVIAMWSGSLDKLPPSWCLCDGTNGTPDLRDKFVVGAGGGYTVGAKGGSIHQKLTEANLPSHSHPRNAKGNDEIPIIKEVCGIGKTVSHVVSTTTVSVSDKEKCKKENCRQFPDCCKGYNTQHYKSQGHEIVTPTPTDCYVRPRFEGSTGAGGKADPSPLDVRPPYYGLAFIMRIQHIEFHTVDYNAEPPQPPEKRQAR
jgi:hypothetical protein